MRKLGLRTAGSEELETQLAALRKQLESNSGILSIPISQIQPNPEQPRQTFLTESINSMSRSLDKDGQLEPIILMRRGDLVIFDGERRWRSALRLGWQNLKAVIISEPIALHRQALLTSLHREDLNPLDKAEAIVRELAENTDIDAADIPRILSTAVRRLNAQKRISQVVELLTATEQEIQQGLANLGLDEREQAVLGLLLDLQLNPASVDANIFPMLRLAPDLKKAIRELGLKGVHAMALSKLNEKNLASTEEEAFSIRVEITQKVIAETLSATKTRKLVNETIIERASSEVKLSRNLKQISKVTGNLQKLSSEKLAAAKKDQLTQLQEVLKQKLAEIEKIIEGD